jgi:hypothetical protein
VRYISIIYLLIILSPILGSKLIFAQIFANTSEIKSKNCYIWIEINSKDNLPNFIKYQEDWRQIGQLIVTGRSHSIVSVIGQLVQLGIPVRSGFKTFDYFESRTFDDPSAWKEISTLARTLSSLTQGQPVIIENESTTKYVSENSVDNLQSLKLQAAIQTQSWPTIWFWYGPNGYRKPIRDLSNQIGEVIMTSIPDVHLIEPNSAGYKKPRNRFIEQSNVERTLHLDPSPISIVYLDDQKPRFWKISQTNMAILSALSDDVIIYPGINDLDRAKDVLSAMSPKTCTN